MKCDRPRPTILLPLNPYRALFFVLDGEVVLILFSAWAIHFRAGLYSGRTHLAEMGIFALVVLVGLFYFADRSVLKRPEFTVGDCLVVCCRLV